MRHISLFTGIGGADIAAEWAGFETVLMVEIDPFCQKVLRKHWPDVPIIGDIKDVTKEKVIANTHINRIESRPSGNMEYNRNQLGEHRPREGQVTEVVESRATNQSPITLLTGGFPCQPFSVAGKRRGEEDDRYLWPEMLKVIEEVRPKWVVAENVAGLVRMGIDDCISDLENIGYTVEPYLIPACAVNAPHRRDRVFIVARACPVRCDTWGAKQPLQGIGEYSQALSTDVADTDREGLQGYRGLRECRGQWLTWQGSEPLEEIWESEPDVGRVAHGVPSRVDRLKALGNAIVPQQVYPILKAIADIEKIRRDRCGENSTNKTNMPSL